MRVPAAFSTAVRPVLTGPIQHAEWLGASASALYLITRSSIVLAIVTHDAVRLPCALALASTATELPLTQLAPAPERRHVSPPSVGAGRVEWAGPAGVVTVACRRQWAPTRVPSGEPRHGALEALSAAVAAHDIGLAGEDVARLMQAGDSAAQFAAVAGLLGRGPGLTPSGDDVVAGFLLGARAFGRAVPGAVAAVAEFAGAATTSLSAQLLEHAARGECVPQVATAVAALIGRPAPCDALERLLAVGHTSGAALALGLVSAAAGARTEHARDERSREEPPRRAEDACGQSVRPSLRAAGARTEHARDERSREEPPRRAEGACGPSVRPSLRAAGREGRPRGGR